jgi:addiction module HigA family antidote
MEMYNPSHAGRILRLHMGDAVTVSALAKHIGMTRANLSMILNGRMGVSASVAIKLAQAFPKTDAQFWMDIQTQYDLARARRKKRATIRPIQPATKPALKKAA